jgi:hypothetical protein
MEIKVRYIRLAIIVVIEILIFVMMSMIVTNSTYNYSLSTGTKVWLAPLVFYTQEYTDSVLNKQNFEPLILIINALIILVIALVLSIKLRHKQ